jgi:hypothetical protein
MIRVLGHGHHLCEDLTTYSPDFYAAVKKAVNARQIADCDFSRIR